MDSRYALPRETGRSRNQNPFRCGPRENKAGDELIWIAQDIQPGGDVAQASRRCHDSLP